MTTHWCDFQNTDVIMNIGSNSVENHPVSAKWLNKAHERGAKWIVVDPRYTRTAEMADIYCPIRSGTDIAFYGGLYNYIVENLIEPNLQKYLAGEEVPEYNFSYLLNYTNASYLLDPDYSFDPSTGLFSGWNEDTGTYDAHSWHYQVESESTWDTSGDYAWAVAPGVPEFTPPVVEHPRRDMTLQDPMCVYQQFKKHYDRYDIRTVCRICGMDEAILREVYETYASTAAPGKSGVILYALGQTQHTYGAQNTRAMSVLQLLLGNVGVAGGGVAALRGEPNVQGATSSGPTRPAARACASGWKARPTPPATTPTSPSSSSRASRNGSATRPPWTTTTATIGGPRSPLPWAIRTTRTSPPSS